MMFGSLPSRCYGACLGRYSEVRGSISIICMVMVLPFLCALLTLVIDLSYFFGVRDELQKVLDKVAHDALIGGRSALEVEQVVRSRMRNTYGIAQINSIQMTASRGKNVIVADGEYRGAFAALAQRLYGKLPVAMSFAARAQVRVQSSAALIIVDRSEVKPGEECSDPTLTAMGLFADRLAETWVNLADTAVYVATTPGKRAALDSASLRGLDEIARCGSRSASEQADMSLVRGVAGSTPYSSMAFAYHFQELVQQYVLAADVRVRSVVVLTRRGLYEQGYIAQAHAAVRDAEGLQRDEGLGKEA